MNRPTIDSMPATAASRPDTVLPKTTSSRPVNRPSTRPHAPCTTVPSVRPKSRARDTTAAVTSGGTSTRTCSCLAASRPTASGVSLVGSASPCSARPHASRAAGTSRSASQPR